MDPLPESWTQVDASVPSPARIYDYLLYGKDNFEADRVLAEKLEAEADGGVSVRELARINRAFVLAAAQWTASMLGISQFIDLGCGLPLKPALHDAARLGCPEARVAYVDRDPMVISHVAALQGGCGLAAVKADASDPDRVLEAVRDLEAPGGGHLLDLARPACVVLGATLSTMDAAAASSAVAAYVGALAEGSAVVISCASYEDEYLGKRMADLYSGAEPGWRNHSLADVTSFFVAAGLRIVRGRVGDVQSWPMLTPETPEAAVIGGVGILD